MLKLKLIYSLCILFQGFLRRQQILYHLQPDTLRDLERCVHLA